MSKVTQAFTYLPIHDIDDEHPEQFMEDVRMYLIQAKWAEQVGDDEGAELFREAAALALYNSMEVADGR